MIALPVLPRPQAERLARECERLITLRAPQRFTAVGEFYDNFDEVPEDEVAALMASSVTALELHT